MRRTRSVSLATFASFYVSVLPKPAFRTHHAVHHQALQHAHLVPRLPAFTAILAAVDAHRGPFEHARVDDAGVARGDRHRRDTGELPSDRSPLLAPVGALEHFTAVGRVEGVRVLPGLGDRHDHAARYGRDRLPGLASIGAL